MSGTWTPIDIDALLAERPAGECGRCGRKTWDSTVVGTEDRMTQPDGFPCGGTFLKRS